MILFYHNFSTSVKRIFVADLQSKLSPSRLDNQPPLLKNFFSPFVLIFAAIKKNPWMRRKYDRLKQWKGGKRAIIAIARNLIIRILRILLNQEPYVVEAVA